MVKSNEKPCVCNVFATFHTLTSVKSRVYSSPNDNLRENNENCKRVQNARVVFTQQRAFLHSFIRRLSATEKPRSGFEVAVLVVFGGIGRTPATQKKRSEFEVALRQQRQQNTYKTSETLCFWGFFVSTRSPELV